MTERDYIIVSNLRTLTNANGVLRDVMPSAEHGVDPDEFALLLQALDRLMENCRKKVKIR